MRTTLLAALIAVGTLLSHAQTVHVITIDATINPAIAQFIAASIATASDEGATCLVIRLNTPGGLLKSTRSIVTSLLTAPLPVVVYVAPAGAQAASAGAFVTLAAHVSAMAPGTNIGAAHPVGMQGGEKDSIMNEKATNDAAAFIRTISEKRHRNIRWAEDAVRRSIAITETEALADSVVDLVTPGIGTLLDAIDGRTVDVNGTPVTLHTRNARVVEKDMSWTQDLLNILSDPNIAYIFMMLGFFGLLFELYNPGAILPGVVGVISLILAFYSMQTLPVNYAGVALIVFGIILFLLELKIISHGLLGIGGTLSVLLGSIMLINPESSLDMAAISWTVILAVVVLTTLFFFFAIGMGMRAQRRPAFSGAEGLLGEHGVALTALGPEGQVRVHGEIWKARTPATGIPQGRSVVVRAVNGLTLLVEESGTETETETMHTKPGEGGEGRQ